MHHDHFDVLTRRASLMALGATGLAAFVSPIPTNASNKKRKRKGNRRNGDAGKLCKKQVEACAAFIREACGLDDGCVDEIDCCSILASCSFDGFLFCFDAATQSPALPART